MEQITETVQETVQAIAGTPVGPVYLHTIIKAAIIIAVSAVIIRVVARLAHKAFFRSKKLDKALASFMESSIKIVLWAVAVIIVADTLGIPTTSLVALVSVAGLALSLSIQSIMANLFSGITLLVTKPFAAGDYVDIAGKAGTVQSVGLFYTVLTTPDNVCISIPNGDVTSASVTNYSREPLRRVDLIYSVSYDSPIEAVKSAIYDAAEEDTRILTDPAPQVALKEYKSSCVDFAARFWCKGGDYWDVYFGMNERVRRFFDDRGVEMTYDHLNVHIMDK